MDYVDDLYALCDIICREIGEANGKIHTSGGKLTAGDIDYVDKLTHALKSIQCSIAMMETDDGYSNRNYSNGGNSYARGRNRNVNRDSLGRYSRENGYSRASDEMMRKLHDLMQETPDEKIRAEFQRFISKMENM